MNEYNEEYWKGKGILITGGSAGLGKSLALELLDRGARVAVVARRGKQLKKLKEERKKIITIQGDVSKIEDIHRISQQAAGQISQIDVLINNASYLGSTPLRQLVDTQCEDLSLVLETNLIGPFRLTKAILPHMLLRNDGVVVNISSDAATSAYATWGSYSISKAALDHMSRIWQEELQSKGIRFYSLDPGDMNTQMHLDAIPDANVTELYDPDDVARSMLQFLQQSEEGKVRYSASEWRELLV